MSRRRIGFAARFAIVAGLLLSRPVVLAEPATADAVLAEAAKAGRSAGRNTLVVFHASWCGWCRKLEAILSSPRVKEIVDRHYVQVELTVLERGEKQALENPGAEALMDSLAGGDAGLPFTAVLERKTKKPIATSNLSGPGTNVGFPAKADEVDHFVGMLRRGAPGMSAAEAETIRAAFPVR